MYKFIAWSGGVESTAMCLLYGKGATAVFTDTGSEHKALYDWLAVASEKLKAVHNGDFNVLYLKPKVKVKGVEVENLTDYIKTTKFLPGKRERFCTRIFKIEVMDDFLSSQDECELLIGLNADEEREGNFGLLSNVSYRTPLQEDGYTRQDCIDVLEEHDLKPKFPAYMKRGGCIFCPFKSKKEFRAMAHLAPDELEQVAKLEEAVQDCRGKFFRIRQNMPIVRDLINQEKGTLFNASELYDDYDGESYSCGVFCHR